ncbi:hypothetical protein GA0061099_1007398 [Bradyrhizobium yuanmingense]|uniref:Uncharacterized protein n=1 Tax=Bradyrhizobium yuanmingense TaxID=108015 RepID=A0A1C3WV46_9BRAD|nr:hypothetical protein IQ15_05156 [Bradyrhizobium yuanmingense]SCB43923.1 hypothetical protein GA0061099_1007398 [Bradyrhizobium yuanmingense]
MGGPLRSFPPNRPSELVLDLAPGHPEILKLAFGHGRELAADPRPRVPGLQEFQQRPTGSHKHRGPWRTGAAGGRDLVQSGQLAALAEACGNGPSAFSVSMESQYSRISLILPSSRRNTRQ